MSYGDFTPDKISKIFGITIEERTKVFTQINELEIDPFFSEIFTE
jgi:hypothetical protein